MKFGQDCRLQLGHQHECQRKRQGEQTRLPARRFELPNAIAVGRRRVQPLECNGVDKEGAGCNRNHLEQQQAPNVVPEPKDGADQDQNRLHVIGQARGNVAVIGRLQKTAAAAVPDGLVDLTEVRLVGAHAGMDIKGQTCKKPDIANHGGQQDDGGVQTGPAAQQLAHATA